MNPARGPWTDAADGSHGYDGVCSEFVPIRESTRVGASTVAGWAKQFPPGASVLDLWCGHSMPISEVLIENAAITDLAEISAGWENEVYLFTVESGKAPERPP